MKAAILMAPELLIVLARPPNQFVPLTFQPPPMLLNVVPEMLNGDVPNATLPDMVPVLLTVTAPVLVAILPLLAPTATFKLLAENSFAVTVPEFVKVAPCELLL